MEERPVYWSLKVIAVLIEGGNTYAVSKVTVAHVPDYLFKTVAIVEYAYSTC